jgi:hypothetical protein
VRPTGHGSYVTYPTLLVNPECNGLADLVGGISLSIIDKAIEFAQTFPALSRPQGIQSIRFTEKWRIDRCLVGKLILSAAPNGMLSNANSKWRKAQDCPREVCLSITSFSSGWGELRLESDPAPASSCPRRHDRARRVDHLACQTRVPKVKIRPSHQPDLA